MGPVYKSVNDAPPAVVEPRVSAREGYLSVEGDPNSRPQEREGIDISSPKCGDCPAADCHPGVPDIRHHEGITGLAPVVCRENVVQHGTTENRAAESRSLPKCQYQGVPLMFQFNLEMLCSFDGILSCLPRSISQSHCLPSYLCSQVTPLPVILDGDDPMPDPEFVRDEDLHSGAGKTREVLSAALVS